LLSDFLEKVNAKHHSLTIITDLLFSEKMLAPDIRIKNGLQGGSIITSNLKT